MVNEVWCCSIKSLGKKLADLSEPFPEDREIATFASCDAGLFGRLMASSFRNTTTTSSASRLDVASRIQTAVRRNAAFNYGSEERGKTPRPWYKWFETMVFEAIPAIADPPDDRPMSDSTWNAKRAMDFASAFGPFMESGSMDGFDICLRVIRRAVNPRGTRTMWFENLAVVLFNEAEDTKAHTQWEAIANVCRENNKVLDVFRYLVRVGGLSNTSIQTFLNELNRDKHIENLGFTWSDMGMRPKVFSFGGREEGSSLVTSSSSTKTLTSDPLVCTPENTLGKKRKNMDVWDLLPARRLQFVDENFHVLSDWEKSEKSDKSEKKVALGSKEISQRPGAKLRFCVEKSREKGAKYEKPPRIFPNKEAEAMFLRIGGDDFVYSPEEVVSVSV